MTEKKVKVEEKKEPKEDKSMDAIWAKIRALEKFAKLHGFDTAKAVGFLVAVLLGCAISAEARVLNQYPDNTGAKVVVISTDDAGLGYVDVTGNLGASGTVTAAEINLSSADGTKVVQVCKVALTEDNFVGRTNGIIAYTNKVSISIPDNAIIQNAWLYMDTALQSTSAAEQVAMNIVTADDLLAAQVVTNIFKSANTAVQMVPDKATVGDYIKLSAALTNLNVVVMGSSITNDASGVVYIEYIPGD